MKNRIQMLLDGCKMLNQLRSWDLSNCGTGKINTLAWHHNLWDLMLGASFSLELSKWHSPSTDTLKRMKKAWHQPHQKDASGSDELTESTRIESRPCWMSDCLVLFGPGSHYSLAEVANGLVLITCPWNQAKCVTEQQSILPTRCKYIHQPDTQSPHQNHQA